MRHHASMTQGSLFLCVVLARRPETLPDVPMVAEAAYPLLLRFPERFLDAGGHTACHHCAP
jgi:hypothetical protein